MRALTIVLFLSFCSSFLQAQPMPIRTFPELLNKVDIRQTNVAPLGV